ncbi:sugar ABC transporter ATP-binding protein [Nocardioides terrisoli]|uniref:sugar ABC transporter ATP-binding protein n=1 Tax=Nocardioides terrisoli TaxID=3388267 RepID=UPI00287BC303|nr:sugar ABC transporter ATP-binding protein [Nocardioides marmorisolisilvae]
MTRAASSSRLRIDNVSKQYGSVVALSEVSLEVRAGEVLALLGENGAGKSTLVKCVAGLQQPDSGFIELDGRRVQFRSAAEAKAAGVAIVTQEFSLVPSMSVAENLALGRLDSGLIWHRRKLERSALGALERVGLGQVDPGIAVRELSVGERQLVEIARVVVRDARVVILDEPTAALSEAEIARVLPLVRDLADSGMAVVYVTHRLDEVFTVCDRVQVMRNGVALPPVETSATDVGGVVALMLGRRLDDMFPARAAGVPCHETRLRVTGLKATAIGADVSFELRAGEIVGFTGQLGSGASATVQAVAGCRPPVAGQVTLGSGSPLNLRSRTHGIRAGIAYCSSDRKSDGIFSGLSVLRNISSPWIDRVARRGWVSQRQESEQACAAALQFALDPERLSSPISTLSGGNQQKVTLAKWTGIDPLVFIADEPTRGVDVGARAEIYQRIRQMADRGVAVLIASSDTNEIFGLADVIATFSHGRMTEMRPFGDWTEQELLSHVMSGRKVSHADDV